MTVMLTNQPALLRMQVFPITSFTEESVILKRCTELANYLLVALMKALMAF